MPPHVGLKFSANLWLHQHDFRGPNTNGCDMGGAMKVVRVKAEDGSIPSDGSPAGGWEDDPFAARDAFKKVEL